MSQAELFELEMLGGAIERRYRKMRPEVEAMPWGTMSPAKYPDDVVIAARKAWTSAAFQEHRTGVACSMTLRALIEVRAPIDLIAMASRFPLDEMVHVELCARMAMELGGGTEIIHDPDFMCREADPQKAPLVRAAELVTRFFCVGEALSIPLLRGTWHAAEHPLAKAVLGRIVKDEAAHGTFGFTFLDWALPNLDAEAVAHVAWSADLAIDFIVGQWDEIRRRPPAPSLEAHPLAWMQSGAYLALAARSMESKVRAPLLERGLPLVSRQPNGHRVDSSKPKS